MNETDSTELQAQLTALPARSQGFAGKAMRLEQRLGWLLWSALLAILLVISV